MLLKILLPLKTWPQVNNKKKKKKLNKLKTIINIQKKVVKNNNKKNNKQLNKFLILILLNLEVNNFKNLLSI